MVPPRPACGERVGAEGICSQLIEGGFERNVAPFARAAVLHLDRAGGEAARADDELVGQADQIHCREFGAGRFVAVVVEHLDPGGEQFAV